MKIVGITLGSWILGCAAYLVALRVIWDEGISRNDLRAVLFWSAMVVLPTTVFILIPAMLALRKWAIGRIANPAWVFVFTGAALGFVQVTMLVAMWSNDFRRALLTPEAALFSVLFGTFGAVFGASFYLAYGRRSA